MQERIARGMKWGRAALLACAALSACSHKGDRPKDAAAAALAANWHAQVTDNDRDRLRRWRDAWLAALPQAKTADAGAVAREGELFDPDRALADAMPPAGAYRCRIFKLGASTPASKGFTSYPDRNCRIDSGAGVMTFRALDGPQRPVGRLYKDGASRAVFLGTLVLTDETRPLDYSLDTTRDMIGYVERVGPQRWRLVFPWPHFESLVDVVELTPAS